MDEKRCERQASRKRREMRLAVERSVLRPSVARPSMMEQMSSRGM